MSKYHASPWGDILGGLGDFVGGKWKGIYWTRKKVWPTQRGTLELYRLLKEGLISPERFSFKQMNIRRLIFSVLGWVGRTNLSGLIYPVWENLCAKRGLQLTGINLFTRRNAAHLFNSMPEKNQEYDASTNTPDMREMLVSDGDLEPAPSVVACTYNSTTGKFLVQWDMACTKNGKSTDYAYVMAYCEPIIDDQWKPNGWMYGKAELPTPPALPKSRGDSGGMEIDLPTGLTATELVGYVFFRDKLGIIGFSPSVGKRAESA